jgi:hypothetical protein
MLSGVAEFAMTLLTHPRQRPSFAITSTTQAVNVTTQFGITETTQNHWTGVLIVHHWNFLRTCRFCLSTAQRLHKVAVGAEWIREYA